MVREALLERARSNNVGRWREHIVKRRRSRPERRRRAIGKRSSRGFLIGSRLRLLLLPSGDSASRLPGGCCCAVSQRAGRIRSARSWLRGEDVSDGSAAEGGGAHRLEVR